MKILLFGKDGQVGRELRRSLLPLGNVIALGRDTANLEDLYSLSEVLQIHKPEIVVNAAAYTSVDKAETDEITARKVNSDAVGVMASYARQENALLVHYSTDYVFDGEKPCAYQETDQTNPKNAYGRTKRAGELAILQSGCKTLIFRTSWVFSAQGHNFIKTILRLAAEREALNVISDQRGAPTSAELIADVTALAIYGFRNRSLSSGIYHLTAAGQTTWHGLACYAIGRALDNGAMLKVGIERIRAIDAKSYPLPAKRPKNSLLDTHALSVSLGLNLPDWTIHVDRVIDRLTRIEITT